MARTRPIALVVMVVLVAACADVATEPTTAPSATPPPTSRVTTTISSTPPPTTVATDPTTTTAGPTTYLVWASGGLEPQFVSSLLERFEPVSVVKGGTVELEAEDGSLIPLEGLAIDRPAHRAFEARDSLADLRPGSVVLGVTSAALRQAGPGDVLTLDGTEFHVSAVVADEVVSHAEVVFDQSDPALPVQRDRFALVVSDLSLAKFEAAVTEIEPETPLRVLAKGETPWFRHANGVLPQVLIKQALGEFSYTGRTGVMFDQDDLFRENRIVTTEVPLLGETVCHEEVTRMLVGAMSRVIEEGLEEIVDPGQYGGCWSPRFIRSGSVSPAGLSRHAWGAAVDINVVANPYGTSGTQDPRLVEIMEAEGFTWGGRWLVPDPMHFEYAVVPSEP